jgi:hypothetical protein
MRSIANGPPVQQELPAPREPFVTHVQSGIKSQDPLPRDEEKEHHEQSNHPPPLNKPHDTVPDFCPRLRDRPQPLGLVHHASSVEPSRSRTKCNVTESDGSFFVLDESNPGEIMGRKPHHDHEGEFWIECGGYASLDIRRRIFARKPPTETN